MSAARVVALVAAAAGAVLLFVPWTWDGYRCGSAVVPGQGLPADLSAEREGGIGQLLQGPLLCTEVLDWVRLIGVALVVAGLVAVVLLGWRTRRRADGPAREQRGVRAAAEPTSATPQGVDDLDISSSSDSVGPVGRRSHDGEN